MPAVLNRTFQDILSESFTLNAADGYWYPVEPGIPLVRVIANSESYCVERRRNARGSWLPIAAVVISEFDPAAWRTWRANWPMVEA